MKPTKSGPAFIESDVTTDFRRATIVDRSNDDIVPIGKFGAEGSEYVC